MPKSKSKAQKHSRSSVIATTLGDLISQVYNTALDDSHDVEFAKRLALSCALKAARHQPFVRSR